jgi:hypothetical protein
MTIFVLGGLMLMAGFLIPIGICAGIYFGAKALLRWLDKALEEDDEQASK